MGQYQAQSRLQHQETSTLWIIVALSRKRLDECPLRCNAFPRVSDVSVGFSHTQQMHFSIHSHTAAT
jgi:hypothetical protein